MVSSSCWKNFERKISLLLWGIRRRPLSGISQGGGYGDAIGSPFCLEMKKWKSPPSLNAIIEDILPKLLYEAELSKKPGLIVFGLPGQTYEDSLVITDLRTFRKIFTEFLPSILDDIRTHETRLQTYNDQKKTKEIIE